MAGFPEAAAGSDRLVPGVLKAAAPRLADGRTAEATATILARLGGRVHTGNVYRAKPSEALIAFMRDRLGFKKPPRNNYSSSEAHLVLSNGQVDARNGVSVKLADVPGMYSVAEQRTGELLVSSPSLCSTGTFATRRRLLENGQTHEIENGQTHEIDGKSDVSDIMRALLPPTRTHGYVIVLLDVARQYIMGQYQFFEMDQSCLGEGIHHICDKQKCQHVF